MNREKKVLRLFSRLNVGGPSLHVVNLAKGLTDYGYVTVLAVGRPDASEGDMEDYAESQGVMPRRIPGFQAAISPWRDLVAFLSIWRLIRRERPDIVHTHTFKAGLLGRLAARWAGVPVIVHTYHGHFFHGYWGPRVSRWVARLESFLAGFTTRVVAISSQVGEDIVNAGIVPAEKICVVDLGFDLDRMDIELKQPPTLRRRFGIGANDTVIAIVARLVPVKNLDLFLHAVCPLLPARQDLHLVIIGDGQERARLETLANELCSSGERARVHFCGFVSPVAAEWADIDLCVCTSRNEGTSVAIIEAVIAKVPVMSTAVGGMPDLLEGGRWGQLLPQDSEAIRNAVTAWLAGDVSTQWLAEASAHFRSRFSMQRLSMETAKLYGEIL